MLRVLSRYTRAQINARVRDEHTVPIRPKGSGVFVHHSSNKGGKGLNREVNRSTVPFVVVFVVVGGVR